MTDETHFYLNGLLINRTSDIGSIKSKNSKWKGITSTTGNCVVRNYVVRPYLFENSESITEIVNAERYMLNTFLRSVIHLRNRHELWF